MNGMDPRGTTEVACPTAASEIRQCDLLLLSWNRADLLVSCVERILKHTTVPSRLMILDNGSTDHGTLACLDEMRGTDRVSLEVVKRPRNEALSIVVNDGLRRTTAPWICLLNNDILVTHGWLSEMIDVASHDPTIGLVNPMSNEFGRCPRRGETIDAIAKQLQVHHGRWREHWKSHGFCVLFSRRVVQAVGYWDEAFQFYFEDTDYAVRARQAGLLCAVAEGAYVYHQGGATLARDPRRLDFFERSQKRFDAKWPHERPRRIACVLPRSEAGSPDVRRAWIRRLANNGHEVWLFVPPGGEGSWPRHVQVHVMVADRRLFAVCVLWKILTKKKRFHRLIVSDRWLGRLLRILTPLHRAEIVVGG